MLFPFDYQGVEVISLSVKAEVLTICTTTYLLYNLMYLIQNKMSNMPGIEQRYLRG